MQVQSRYRLQAIRTYTRPIGRQCLHCGRPATTTAVRAERKRWGLRMEVAYCDHHLAEAQQVYG